MNSVKLGTQAITPSKIICVGRNYVEHIAELGNEVPDQMVVFLKPNSAVADSITIASDEPSHYEAELCFLYSAGDFNAVGLGIDITRRELQSRLKAKGLPWERAKAFDGSAVFSEFVPLAGNASDKAAAVAELSLQLDINGSTVQSGGVDLMMYKPDVILREIQSFMSLEDGDIVMTGTPAGVGALQHGDSLSGKVLQGDKEILNCQWNVNRRQ